MKITGILFCIATLGLGSFGIWGLFTDAGHRKYDEMDAMYPAMALLAAIILVPVGLLLLWLSGRRRKGERRGFPVVITKRPDRG